MFSAGFRIRYIFDKHPQSGNIFRYYQQNRRFNICSNFLQHFYCFPNSPLFFNVPGLVLTYKDGCRAGIIAIFKKNSLECGKKPVY